MKSLLHKLQRRTLIKSQLVAYALSLVVGVGIVLLVVAAYVDLRPLLSQQTDVFKAHTVTVSKNITMFKTANKEGIYFDDKELRRLKEQEFVSDVATFNSASFNASAAITFGGQRMSTELFFESVPDRYLDVQSDDWRWDSTSGFVPVIIPEEYLNLYNFGFAESQSLPVVSSAMLSQVTFNIYAEGNGRRGVYESRIVGLSGKINSILVPEDFLKWANRQFGSGEEERASRLLVEFSNASDERIPQYFEANALNINKTELESSKLTFVFRVALLFLFFIAVVITLLSMMLIVMGMNLIVQRNRQLFSNLSSIGYGVREMSGYYRVVIGGVTVVAVATALLVGVMGRRYYVGRLSSLFEVSTCGWTMYVLAVVVLVMLLAVCMVTVRRSIAKAVAEE